MIPIQTLPARFFKIYFNIIFPSMPWSFPHQHPACASYPIQKINEFHDKELLKTHQFVLVCKKLGAIYVGTWTARKVGRHKTIIKEAQACNLLHYEV
jgi:hypothetical protein